MGVSGVGWVGLESLALTGFDCLMRYFHLCSLHCVCSRLFGLFALWFFTGLHFVWWIVCDLVDFVALVGGFGFGSCSTFCVLFVVL